MLVIAFVALFIGYVIAINVATWWLIPATILAFVVFQSTEWFRRQEMAGLFYMFAIFFLVAGEAFGLIAYWSKYPDEFFSLFNTVFKFLVP